MRRLFILWSTVHPSKIQLFGATASYSLHYLSSFVICSDDSCTGLGSPRRMINNSDINGQVRAWVIAKDNPPSIAQVVLIAVASIVSYLIARLFGLPEAYWAPMSTLIVMKLTLSAALPIAVQYVAGTAVGAAVGAVTGIYFHASVWTFGVAVILVGLVCVALRVERSAFRYASI